MFPGKLPPGSCPKDGPGRRPRGPKRGPSGPGGLGGPSGGP